MDRGNGLSDYDSIDISDDWQIVIRIIKNLTGKKADINGILFLIGINELGDISYSFTKEEKQDLLHIATCKIFSYSGYYELEGLDKDGWPHWRKLKSIPIRNIKDQEEQLMWHIITYFKNEMNDIWNEFTP